MPADAVERQAPVVQQQHVHPEVVEHRWYAFTGLEMALFVDAGKTVSQKGQITPSGLNYSGGVGFRARVNDAVVLRFDIAKSREGLRWIWSMSDISRRRF